MFDNVLWAVQTRHTVGDWQDDMALPRDFKETIVDRVKREPDFAIMLWQEARDALLTGEPEKARLILRDLINDCKSFVGPTIAVYNIIA